MGDAQSLQVQIGGHEDEAPTGGVYDEDEPHDDSDRSPEQINAATETTAEGGPKGPEQDTEPAYSRGTHS